MSNTNPACSRPSSTTPDQADLFGKLPEAYTMKHHRARTVILTALTLWAIGYNTVLQADVNLGDTPLFITANVDPNIMLLIDTSGSMLNIVPEAPFDAGLNYSDDPNTAATETNCPPGATTIAAGVSVDIRIVSALPKIRLSGTNYTWGAASGQRCFDKDANYGARLNADAGTAPGSYLDAQYTGNYLNWYFNRLTTTPNWTNEQKKPGTQSRFEIAKASAIALTSGLSNVRLGLASYNNGNGGTIQEGVKDIDIAANRTSVQAKINALTAAGATPLAESLQDIGRYFVQGFNNTLTLHPGQATESTAAAYTVFDHVPAYATGVVQASPIQAFCQKSFAVLLTDGRPQSDRAISAASNLRDYTGDCAAGLCIAASTGANIPNIVLTDTSHQNGTKVGRRYESQGSDYLDDVAAALFDIDLRPDLDDFDGNEVKNNISTYTIGFADDEVINDPLMQSTADEGGGTFETAADSAELATSFSTIFESIEQTVGAAASVAASSGFIGTDTSIFLARFNSNGWFGELISFPIDVTGTIGTERWDAGELIPAAAARNIFTIDPGASVGSGGVAFEVLADLTTSQQTALNTDPSGTPDSLGQARLDYLRGDQTNEEPDGLDFRARDILLGDLVNSAPEFVGVPAFRYPDTWETGAAENAEPYSDFVAAQASRTPVVYVGANDGMLHAFNAVNNPAAGGGSELFAFVPDAVFPNLTQLTGLTYNSNHLYFVDGSPNAGDAFFGGAWHTVLVGGLGNGGKSIYALDITDPTAFDEGNVLWEFTDVADLGFTYSQPVVVRMHNQKWVAIFGNGYNSTNHDAALFIVDIETGALIKKIVAGDPADGTSASPNGLNSPAAVDADGDRIVDYVYAGDLKGNMWKFDVSSDSDADWDVAFSGAPLFTATDSSGNPQPITSRPQVGAGASGGQIVLFGTGKYLGNNDVDPLIPENLFTQTFYGIHDDNVNTVSGRGDLLQQSVLGTVTVSGDEFRVTSANPLGSESGWYLDLPTSGERQVSNSVLRNGRIIFTTIIPDNTLCGLGGTGWLMELNASNGSRFSFSPFDVNDDGDFDESDFVTVAFDVDGDGDVDADDKVPVSGKGSEDISSGPTVLGGDGSDIIVISGSGGDVDAPPTATGDSTPRQSWRQLQ